jgi:hypothetical protein
VKVSSQTAQEYLCRHIHIDVRGTLEDDRLRKVTLVLLARNDLATSLRTITIVQRRGKSYHGLSTITGGMIPKCARRFEVLKKFALLKDLEIAAVALLLSSPRLYALDTSPHFDVSPKFWKILHRLKALKRVAPPYQGIFTYADLAF